MSGQKESIRFEVTVDNEELKKELTSGVQEILNTAGKAKAISEALRADQAQIKAAQEFKERLVSIRFDTEQAMIDTQSAGYDKHMAQIELNYKRKLTSIEIWERAQRKALEDAQKAAQEAQQTAFVAQGGDPKEFKFNDDTYYHDAMSTVSTLADKQRTAATAERTTTEVKLLGDMKNKWSSWSEQYEAIEAQITKTKNKAAQDRKLIDAQLERGDIEPQQATAAKDKVDKGEQSAVADLDSQKNKMTASWSGLFSDLKSMSRAQTKKLIDEIDAQLADKKLSAPDTAALTEQLDKAKKHLTEVTPFVQWVDSLGDVKRATEAVAEARKKVDAANDSGSEKDKAEAQKGLDKAQKELASAKEKKETDAKASLNDVSQVASATSGLLKTFGVKSPAVEGVVGSLTALASINWGNPVSIITGGLKAITSLIGGIFGEMDLAKEKEIKRIQGEVDELENSYAKLGEEISKAYSIDASNKLEESNAKLEEQNKLIEQQKALEDDKKTKDKGKIEAYDKATEQNNRKIEENKEKAVDAIFGSDLKSAINNFASAYMNAWAAGGDQAAAQKDVVKNMLNGIVQEMLKADIAGQVETMRTEIAKFLKPTVDDNGNVEQGGVLTEAELKQIDAMAEGMGKTIEKRKALYDQISERYKPEKDETEKSLTGQIRGTVATEQSVAELGGIFRGQYEKLSSMDSKMDLGVTQMLEIARTNALIETNTRRTADNTDGLREELQGVKNGIAEVIKNTKPDNGTL